MLLQAQHLKIRSGSYWNGMIGPASAAMISLANVERPLQMALLRCRFSITTIQRATYSTLIILATCSIACAPKLTTQAFRTSRFTPATSHCPEFRQICLQRASSPIHWTPLHWITLIMMPYALATTNLTCVRMLWRPSSVCSRTQNHHF